MSTLTLWVAPLGLCLFAAPVRAQEAQDEQPAAPATREHRLGPQDKVSYKVEEDPARAKEEIVTVSALGELRLRVSQGYDEFITVEAAGRTLAEVQDDVRKRLEQDYYHKATVRMSLADRAAAFGHVHFYGEAKGVIKLAPATEKKKLSEALIELGWTDFADLRKITVHRINPATGEREAIPVDALKILQPRGKTPEDFLLQDEDRVHVPERSLLFFKQVK